MFQYTLVIAIFTLLISPILVFILGKWNEHVAKWTAFGAVLTSAIFALLTIGDVLYLGAYTDTLGGFTLDLGVKQLSINFILVADSLSLPIAGAIYVLALAVIMYSFGYTASVI